jgi:hypothetical protein
VHITQLTLSSKYQSGQDHRMIMDSQQEQVQTVTTKVEPATGDKRPREDDGSDQKTNGTPPSQNVNQLNQINGMYAAQAMGQGVVGDPGYDSLYIGDLQWVRLSCRLASCAYCPEIDCLPFPPPPPPCLMPGYSGLLTKICDKSP